VEVDENTAGSASQNLVVTVTSTIDAVQGWSFGVQTDADAGATMSITDAAIAGDVLALKNGAPADFKTTVLFLNPVTDPATTTAVDISVTGQDGYGLTQGVVIDFMAQVTMDASTQNAAELTVTLEGTVGGRDDPNLCGRLIFTNDLGSPPTATVVVVGGASLPPITESAEICLDPVEPPPPPTCAEKTAYTMQITGGTGGTNATVPSTVYLNFDGDGTNTAAEIQGWSYGICIDEYIAIVDATTDGTDTATVKNGAPPDFNTVTVYPGEGITHGVVIDFMAQVTLTSTNEWSDLNVNYELLVDGLNPVANVTPCSATLGSPATANVMVIGGASIPMSNFEGPLADRANTETGCCEDAQGETECNVPGEFLFLAGYEFIPGDANCDGRLDIADGIWVLNYLFRQGPPPCCECAADANNDTVLDASDAVYIIEYQFLDGDPPPLGTECTVVEPAACGSLSCDVLPPCP
jgi:hypothetical protein